MEVFRKKEVLNSGGGEALCPPPRPLRVNYRLDIEGKYFRSCLYNFTNVLSPDIASRDISQGTKSACKRLSEKV